MTDFKYAYHNDEYIDIKMATLPLQSTAVQYGLGIFGGIRGYYNADLEKICILKISEHYKRIINSTKILGCSFNYSLEELLEINKEIVRKNNINCNCYFRPYVYSKSTAMTPTLHNIELGFSIYAIPLEEYIPKDKGLSVTFSSWQRINDNAIPARGKFCGAYINSSLARKEADENGYDEALFLTRDGNVSEGSAENIFIVRDGILITPPVTDDILEGITRHTIMSIAEGFGYKCIERSIDRTELYIADEVFLCGTGAQISWVKSVDKRIIGNGEVGPLTDIIRAKYFDIVYGKDQKHHHWITFI